MDAHPTVEQLRLVILVKLQVHHAKQSAVMDSLLDLSSVTMVVLTIQPSVMPNVLTLLSVTNATKQQLQEALVKRFAEMDY